MSLPGLHPGDRIELERLGGLGGFGLPGSHIRSRAVFSADQLHEDERRLLATLLDAGGSSASPTPGAADAFRCRVTIERAGRRQVIEVPESALPARLTAQIRDELI